MEVGVEDMLIFLFVWVVDGGEGEVECLLFVFFESVVCC